MTAHNMTSSRRAKHVILSCFWVCFCFVGFFRLRQKSFFREMFVMFVVLFLMFLFLILSPALVVSH